MHNMNVIHIENNDLISQQDSSYDHHWWSIMSISSFRKHKMIHLSPADFQSSGCDDLGDHGHHITNGFSLWIVPLGSPMLIWEPPGLPSLCCSYQCWLFSNKLWSILYFANNPQKNIVVQWNLFNLIRSISHFIPPKKTWKSLDESRRRVIRPKPTWMKTTTSVQLREGSTVWHRVAGHLRKKARNTTTQGDGKKNPSHMLMTWGWWLWHWVYHTDIYWYYLVISIAFFSKIVLDGLSMKRHERLIFPNPSQLQRFQDDFRFH